MEMAWNFILAQVYGPCTHTHAAKLVVEMSVSCSAGDAREGTLRLRPRG